MAQNKVSKYEGFNRKMVVIEPSEAIGNVMKLSSLKTPIRWEIGGDILLGRKNLQLLQEKIRFIKLDDLINLQVVAPEDPGGLLTIDQFYQQNLLPPEPLSWEEIESRWKVDYLNKSRLPNQQLNPMDEMAQQAAALAVMNIADVVEAMEYNKERALAHLENEQTRDRIRSEKLSLRKLFLSEVANKQRERETYERHKREFDEKVKALNKLIAEYFSDNIVAKVQENIQLGEFDQLFQRISRHVFSGNLEEGRYLTRIIDQTHYHRNFIWPVFRDTIELVFHMMDECHNARTDVQKLGYLEEMIERGDCAEFKEALKVRRNYKDYNYVEVVDQLNDTYERIKAQPIRQEKRKYETEHELSQVSVSTSNKKPNKGFKSNKEPLKWCSICRRMHHGDHDPAKAKEYSERQPRRGYAERTDKDANQTTSSVTSSKTKNKSSSGKVTFEEFLKDEHDAYMISEIGIQEESAISVKYCSDSGASTTMTPSTANLSDIRQYSGKVKVANGVKESIISKGKLLQFGDALIVPSLNETLVSVSQCDKMGYFTVYGNKQVLIYDRNPLEDGAIVIAKGSMETNGLYYFDADGIFKSHLAQPSVEENVEGDSEDNEELNNNDVENGDYWYDPDSTKEPELLVEGEYKEPEEPKTKKQRIFNNLQAKSGLSKAQIRKAINEDAIINSPLPKDDLRGLDMRNSGAWYRGNMKSFHLGRAPDDREYKAGELVGLDIGPPFTIRQQNGNYYPFVFVDSATKYIWVKGSATKTGVNQAIKEVKAEITYNKHEWLAIQVDAERVLTLGDVKKTIVDLGLKLRVSAPYKHGQNGMIERYMGILYDVTRTIMLISEVPTFLMIYCLQYAAFILNNFRIPTGKTVTAHQAFTGRKSDFKTLQQFMGPGYAYISKDQRKGKTAAKSDLVRFIGWAPDYSNAAYCYDPAKHTVKVRHDVAWTTDEHVATVVKEVEIPKNIPNSVREALDGIDRDKWLEAMKTEMRECFSRGTFRLHNEENSVRRGHLEQPLKSRFVFTIKQDGRYKARWVACGYSQVEGLDYNETFAPTAQYKSILTLIHLLATEDGEVYLLDVGNAFLEAEIDVPISIYPPRDLINLFNLENQVLWVAKSLYGLKQAGRLWSLHLQSILHSYGFRGTPLDPSVYKYQKEKMIVRVVVHVDDIMLTTNGCDGSQLILDEVVSFLSTKLKKVTTVRGPDIFSYLGVEYVRDRTRRVIKCNQKQYLLCILERYGNYSRDIMSPYPINSKQLEKESVGVGDYKPIQDVIGSLRFLVDRTRPDLLYPVNLLSRFMVEPSVQVLIELQRVLAYLRGTISYELILGGKRDIDLQAMSDASLGEEEGYKSQLAYIIRLNCDAAPVSSYSRKSSTVALSSTQAETDALVECIKELIWFQAFLKFLLVDLKTPSMILVDNEPTITLAHEGNHLKRSKHFHIKVAFLKEAQAGGIVDIHHVAGVQNTSDILTKSLSGHLLRLHTCTILGHNLLSNDEEIYEAQEYPIV